MRLHRVTHPVLGLATWREIWKARDRIRKETGDRVCSWCHGPVAPGRRTFCGRLECEEMVHRAQSWGNCRLRVLCVLGHAPFRYALCALCGGRASEVDHITPVSLGGSGDLENLRALCSACHKEESARLARAKGAYVARISRGELYGARP